MVTPSGSQNVWKTTNPHNAMATTTPPSQAAAIARPRMSLSNSPAQNGWPVPSTRTRTPAAWTGGGFGLAAFARLAGFALRGISAAAAFTGAGALLGGVGEGATAGAGPGPAGGSSQGTRKIPAKFLPRPAGARTQGIRKLLDKFLRRRVGVETDGVRVGADETAPIDARRPARDVAAFERLEEADADLRIGRDRRQRDLPPLALAAQAYAERIGRQWCVDLLHGTSAVCKYESRSSSAQ